MKFSAAIKPYISLSIDLSIALVCSILSLWIRLGDQMNLYDNKFYTKQACLFLIACLISNLLTRVYQGTWRYFNFVYFKKLVKYSILSCLIFTFFIFLDKSLSSYPRSAIIINLFLIPTLTSIPRWLYRFLSDKLYINLYNKNWSEIPSVNVLIIGLNKNTETFLKELNNLREINYNVLGILDDKNFVGRTINDIKVLGTAKDLKKVTSNFKKHKKAIQRVLISPEYYVGGELRKIIDTAESLTIPVSSFPRLSDINNNFGVRPIKSIPLEDLLRRPQRDHNREDIKSFIKGKKVLITGAGGSIGSEISRQVADNSPKEIAILDNCEFLLYEIEQQILENFPKIQLKLFLTDIRDEKLVEKNIKEFKPDVIFHAAALKHVPMIESNQEEAIKTNVIGTNNIIKSATKNNVSKFIFISTDKAVNPSSFMGASKRMAETICFLKSNSSMQISIVRFGNVLGSNGSVVPIFERQIAKGGPITITHKDATRYFMTIKEAVFLVLQTSVYQNDCFQVFILDMGEPISIHELAKNMISISGLILNKDIEIKFIGLRPGEKLHEELYYQHEELQNTKNPSIFVLSSEKFSKEISKNFSDNLNNLLKTKKIDDLKKLTKKIIH